MPSDHAQALFRQAAALTNERIRADREVAPDRVKPVLAYLEEHLFDRDVNAERVIRACGIRDHNFTTSFGRAVGLPLKKYIHEHRLQTAARLLQETPLKVKELSDLLAFSEPRYFVYTFKRWAGITPSEYRRQQLSLVRPAGFTEVQDETALTSIRTAFRGRSALVSKALEGDLSREEALIIAAELHHRFPETVTLAEYHLHPSAVGPAQSKPPDGLVEQLAAERFWAEIQPLPWQEQKEAVRRQSRFKTPALFRLLAEQHLEAGRRDRRVGLAIAELGLDSVRALEGDLDDDMRSLLEAQAWAHIGNARRLLLDLSGAARAFKSANRRVPENPDPAAHAEILFLEAALKWYQRRETEGIRNLEKALQLIEGEGQEALMVKILTLRSILIKKQEGPLAAIDDLNKALKFSVVESLADLKFGVLHNLACCLLESGNLAASESVLAEAKNLAERSEVQFWYLEVIYLEGLLAARNGDTANGKAKLRRARAGFLDMRQFGNAAITSLDLAELYAEEGQLSEAKLLSAELLPLFRALYANPEARVAHNILKTNLDEDSLSLAVLQSVKGMFRKLKDDPTMKLDY